MIRKLLKLINQAVLLDHRKPINPLLGQPTQHLHLSPHAQIYILVWGREGLGLRLEAGLREALLLHLLVPLIILTLSGVVHVDILPVCSVVVKDYTR